MGDWGQAGQGAMGGAAMGGTIGSIVPGIGTAIGAGVGGLIGGAAGYFGSGGNQSSMADQLNQLAAGYGKRTAPQMGAAAQSKYSGFRGDQASLIAQLQAMAGGNGPSASALQMRDGMDRAAGAQASAAAGAGGRGVNAGAALRSASNNTAAIDAQGNRDMGLARVQEQLGAINQLGTTIGQGRQADEGVNMFNAGQQNQNAQANLSAQLQAMGINTPAQLNALIAAMGGASKGLGTQIMAGGATSMPLLAQMMMGKGGSGSTAGSDPGTISSYAQTASQGMPADF